MPGKHRPLEALNSINLACPRDLHLVSSPSGPQEELHEWSQLPVEGARCPRNRLSSQTPLSRMPTLRPENVGRNPAYFWHLCWVKNPHFKCLEIHIRPLGETTENNFNAACGLWPLCRVRGRLFLDRHALLVVH